MRSILSALLVIVGLLVTAVAGPAMWLQHNVIDSKGFVALAGPLGANKSFQDGLGSMLSEQATASLNLPPQLNAIAGTVIGAATRSVYSDPGYEAAWRETLQRSHELTFKAAGNADIAGDIKLDLAPLLALVVDKVAGDLPISLPTPGDVVVSVEQPEAATLLPVATKLGGWAGWLALIAVGLLLLGVVTAPRKSLAFLLVGVGVAAVALVWLLASGFVQAFLAELTVGPDAAKQIGVELGALARASWQGGINITFIAAGVIAAAGVATLMVPRSRTT